MHVGGVQVVKMNRVVRFEQHHCERLRLEGKRLQVERDPPQLEAKRLQVEGKRLQPKPNRLRFELRAPDRIG